MRISIILIITLALLNIYSHNALNKNIDYIGSMVESQSIRLMDKIHLNKTESKPASSSSYSLISYGTGNQNPKYYYKISLMDIMIRAAQHNVPMFIHYLKIIKEETSLDEIEIDSLKHDLNIYGYQNIGDIIETYILKKYKNVSKIRKRLYDTLDDIVLSMTSENILITNYVRGKVKSWLKINESIIISARLNKSEIIDLINKITVSIKIMKLIEILTH